MIARLAPDASQIRFYAQSALHGFDTLDPADAADNAKADIRSLLAYVNALEGADAIPIFGIEQVEALVLREWSVGDAERADFADLKVSRFPLPRGPGHPASNTHFAHTGGIDDIGGKGAGENIVIVAQLDNEPRLDGLTQSALKIEIARSWRLFRLRLRERISRFRSALGRERI